MISEREIPNVLDMIRRQERRAALDGLMNFVLVRASADEWRRICDLIDDYKSREGLGDGPS